MDIKQAARDKNEENMALGNQILDEQWSKWGNVNDSIPEEMKHTHQVQMGSDLMEVDPGNISETESESEGEITESDLMGLDRVFMALWKAHMDTLKKKLKSS